MRLGIAPALILTSLLISIGPVRAQDDVRALPEASGFVNDLAGIMDESSRAQLEGFLDQVKRKTGAEFAVLVVQTTAPIDPDQYKVEVFQHWGLGEAGKDNGLLMLVALNERVVRFETGYGLEGTLPDGLQSRIFRRAMRPLFRNGDFTGGITAGVLQCSARIAESQGVALEWNGRELRYTTGRSGRRGLSPLALMIVIVLFLVFGSLFGGHGPGGRIGRGRGGYWGGYWGGGFGGGGGGGSSFGGFGGGMSGGGGGGGSW